MNIFRKLLAYALLVATTNNFVWFALTYFAYLQTRSVVSTGIVGGLYLVGAALSGFWLGSIVDRHRKKQAMLGASIATLALFSAGFVLHGVAGSGAFTSVASPVFWLFAVLLLTGALAGNILNIAIPTLVTQLVPEDRRDRANGLFGTVMGISFAITSVASGLVLGFLGMGWVLGLAVGFTVLAIAYGSLLPLEEQRIMHAKDESHGKADLRGTIQLIRNIPGMFPLIFFTTFNNLLGGVFMALMDAYGLSLVSVQAWGLLWGLLSFGFIFGGMYIAKKGLGKNPLRTMFTANMVIWIACILFPVQPSIVLLAAGSLIWMFTFPFIEATEQTIIQKVVPPQRQGRVFGFAHSVEQSASPLTAFLIGPITHVVFIPLMTTGAGARTIGSWFGVGAGRGIALVFILAGGVGLVITLLAMRSRAYKTLSDRYASRTNTTLQGRKKNDPA